MNSTAKRKRRVKESRGTTVAKWAIRVVMVLWAILVLYPLFWAVITSFKNTEQFMTDPWKFPSKWMFSNYATAWVNASFAKYFFNSVYVTLGAGGQRARGTHQKYFGA